MKRFLALFLVLLFVVGCGSGQVPLGGTVTFEDGTPLTVGSVCFASATVSVRGDIDSQGKYTVGTLTDKDGLPPGTYKVYISGATEETPPQGGGLVGSTRLLIDSRYANEASTPLTLEVPAPNNRFDIAVPRNPALKP